MIDVIVTRSTPTRRAGGERVRAGPSAGPGSWTVDRESGTSLRWAGVSRQTVSRVLNDHPSLTPSRGHV
ncbi:hypothetical protein [Glutamicibacter sp. NPDC090743]|uniref:hypothetical protein n=1 Tax=Glutamicibacter sp. NPDC090743 TaxID=3364001 RepID=UPI003817F85E